MVGENEDGTITSCYWSDYAGNGIGNDITNAGETTKVDDSTTWETAMSTMNVALTNAGAGWQYVPGSGDAPLTLQKQ